MGRKGRRFSGHTGVIYSLEFSKDGTLLASGGADNCVRVWNTTTLHASGPSEAEEKPLASFFTKESKIVKVHFTNRNIMLTGAIF